MFSFSHIYPTSVYKDGQKPRNVRTRILGVRHPDKVLYLLMTSNSTEILLVEKNMNSKTVLSFNRYVEIICADISSDDNLLIYTERIPNDTNFSFRSNIFILSSLYDVKAFEDNSPITSFFLPDFIDNDSNSQSNDKKEYHFLNIIGNSITHFRATFVNKKLQIKHERLWINLTNCRSFYYDTISNNNRLICAITRNNTAHIFDFGQNRYFFKTDYKLTSYETINFCKCDILNLSRINNSKQSKSGGFSFFNFSKDKNKNKNDENSFNISTTITPELALKLMNKYTMLPPELALLPTVLANNPFFRFSTGNMYVVRVLPLSLSPNILFDSISDSIETYSSSSASSLLCKDFVIIEQLYRGEEFPLAFSFTIVEKNYSRIIEVPNVQPDVPINFLSFGSLAFIFVLNSFMSMIDFAVFPPSIYFLPRVLCQGPKIEPNKNSGCDISTTTGNFTVDLESGEVYQIEILMDQISDNLKLNFSDRKILKIFATLVARIPKNNISLPAIINKLPLDEIGTLIFFFQSLFQIGLAMDLNVRPSPPKSNLPKSNTPKSTPPRLSSLPPSMRSGNINTKTPGRASSTVTHLPDHLVSSLSSSSSASGGSVSLLSIDESAINAKNSGVSNNNDHLNVHNQSQNQIPSQSVISRTHSYNPTKIRIKHYGKTIGDLGDMRPPLTQQQISSLFIINKEYPSLGKYTRIDSFLHILVQFKSLNVRERDGPDIAIKHLLLQNQLSHIIRNGLDLWESDFSPNKVTKFVIKASILSEAIKNSAPLIHSLRFELEELADDICPLIIRNYLRCSAKLVGISWVGGVIASISKQNQSSTNSTNISFSGDSDSQFSLPKAKSVQRRKTLSSSAAIFSYNKPLKGKRNSLSSLRIATKKVQFGNGKSSSNFFRKLKSIDVQNAKNDIPLQKSYDPQKLFNSIKNHEELELKYWLTRLSPKFSELVRSKFATDSESSNFGTNSVAFSILTDSQWSRADSILDSE